MDCVLKTDSNIASAPLSKPLPKKDRTGRWTQSEAYLFETLLERHGKNWKKIHQYMKGRTLSQIRSHGQKYFAKIGPKRVEELERRAKLLEAYETLQNQKRLQEQTVSKSETPEEKPLAGEVKMEEESPVTVEESGEAEEEEALSGSPSEIIKEQIEKQSQQIKEQALAIPALLATTPYAQINNGFLISLIHLYPETFRTYGIEGFIDHPLFRNNSPIYFQ